MGFRPHRPGGTRDGNGSGLCPGAAGPGGPPRSVGAPARHRRRPWAHWLGQWGGEPRQGARTSQSTQSGVLRTASSGRTGGRTDHNGPSLPVKAQATPPARPGRPTAKAQREPAPWLSAGSLTRTARQRAAGHLTGQRSRAGSTVTRRRVGRTATRARTQTGPATGRPGPAGGWAAGAWRSPLPVDIGNREQAGSPAEHM